MKTATALVFGLAGTATAQDGLPTGAGSLLERAPAQIRLPQREIWRTDDWSGPAPSNRWWSSLLWDRYSLPVWADPISLRARADGLAFGWPELSVDQDGFRAHHRDSLRVSVPGLSAEATLVSGFSDWTVDLVWPREEGPALAATVMKGSPYLWFTAEGAAATVLGAAEAVELELAGRKVVQLSADGRTWLLILPDDAGVALAQDVQLSFGADREFVLAVAPDDTADSLELLAQYAGRRPGATSTSWRWLRDRGVVQVDFDFGSGEQLLTGLYPHQYRRSGQELLPLAYATPRGELRLALTEGFSLDLPFSGVLPAIPAGERASEAGELLQDYLENTRRLFGLMPGQTRESDSYSDGKSFGRLVSLLTIADQLGDAASADLILGELKARLEDWFTADASPSLYYDPLWGALLASPTSHGHDAELNDHPFHYGYFLQAAASVAERDPAWARDWGQVVDLLVRDTAAGRDDSSFPFLRAVDPYTGHGWASGSGRYDRGNNLESSSEAVNHAAGLLRWAEAIGDEELLHTAAFLYASQVDAVWEYWFAAGGNFPDGFDRTAVGIVWSDGGAYGTWWTGDPGAIHGINFLPITSGSSYLARDPGFVLENYEAMTQGRAHYWPDIALQYLAFADPHSALAEWNRALPVEFGEAAAKTLWYLDGLASNGTPTSGIWSNFAQSGVLASETGRTYIAFNPAAEAQQVTFSDGISFQVDARSLGEFHVESSNLNQGTTE